MSKVFYDRSGKAHIIGNKDDSQKGESEGRGSSRTKNRGEKRSEKSSSSSTKGKFSTSSASRGTPPRSASGGDRFGQGKGSKARSGKSSRDKKGSSRGAPREEPRSRRPQNHTLIDRSQLNLLRGIIDKNKRGSAFLIFDRRDLEDVRIPRFYTDALFHGDRVEVYVSDEGEIEDLKVTEHRFREIFGRMNIRSQGRSDRKAKKAAGPREGFLIYERKRAKEEVYVSSIPKEVNEGDWVRAEMVFEEGKPAHAVIQEVIGPDLPAKYDIQMVAGEFNLIEYHSFEAVKQAEALKLEVPGKDEEGRLDLRKMPFMTIDGESARDFDDAICVEDLGKEGYRLWVAIADVSHYVEEKTPLDDEAYRRGTSVYFPERAFHMLPRALSEGLCSLKPDVPRLAMVCSIDFDSHGEKGEIKLYDGLIQSHRRATYTEIENEKDQPEHATMFSLYRILKRLRHARGSIDFEFPEPQIILDEESGEPLDSVVRERGDAHRLIEEFMIAANESVAEWMLERNLPFVYRVHDEPSMEAIAKFKTLAKNMGMSLADGGDGVPRPKVLNEFIIQLKGMPSEPVLATALLRSMRQAIYSADHGEHYGLASEGYSHFTSPIRRYPDLVVHRQLRAAMHRERDGKPHPQGKEAEKIEERLEEISEHCSYRERVAAEADREAIRFKQVRLMAKHIGEELDGKINGLAEKGMFVQLFHPHCEGMVPVESIGDDYYEFNEERMILAGRRKKRTFTIGQEVRIQVVRVDLDARQVEFGLISKPQGK